jgi:hypothetical protein
MVVRPFWVTLVVMGKDFWTAPVDCFQSGGAAQLETKPLALKLVRRQTLSRRPRSYYCHLAVDSPVVWGALEDHVVILYAFLGFPDVTTPQWAVTTRGQFPGR